MTYKETLILYLKNLEGKIAFEWTDDMSPFSDLASMGVEMIEKGSIEGKIAALFIFQQLTIEMSKHLINYCNFYIKLSMFPTKIEFKKLKDSNKYSEIINELKFKNDFKYKQKFLQQVEELNKLRDKFCHELFSGWWSHDINKDLSGLSQTFDQVFNTWKECLNDLRMLINKEKLRPQIQKLIK